MIDFKINRLLMLSVDHDYFDSKPVNNIDKLTNILYLKNLQIKYIYKFEIFI